MSNVYERHICSKLNSFSFCKNKKLLSNVNTTRFLTYNSFIPTSIGSNSLFHNNIRSFSSNNSNTVQNFWKDVKFDESKVFNEIYQQMSEETSKKFERLTELKKKYGNKVIDNVTVTSILGGLRGVFALVTETSQIDKDKGILIHGLSIKELLDKLPKPSNANYPYTEAVFWFLLTGRIPTMENVLELSKELVKLGNVPKHIYSVLDSLPNNSYPMMQYGVAVSALQTESVFKQQHSLGNVNKNNYWKFYLQDALSLVAKSMPIVAYIYNRTFINHNIRNGQGMDLDPKLDYSSNLSNLLGLKAPNSDDMIRLYLAIHSDHEGGNVSAHSAHIISSALGDPFLSISGMLGGLSGPLHGLANQECILWLKNLQKSLGGAEPTIEMITKMANDTLAKGQVIPGYGHAVLRISDPRHDAMIEFAKKHIKDDPLFNLADICLQCIPDVLIATNKIKCPYPNVDCCTGVVLNYFGLKNPEFYTVLFGLSRSLGVLAQMVWARALRMPIDRPKSCTLDHLTSLIES